MQKLMLFLTIMSLQNISAEPAKNSNPTQQATDQTTTCPCDTCHNNVQPVTDLSISRLIAHSYRTAREEYVKSDSYFKTPEEKLFGTHNIGGKAHFHDVRMYIKKEGNIVLLTTEVCGHTDEIVHSKKLTPHEQELLKYKLLTAFQEKAKRLATLPSSFDIDDATKGYGHLEDETKWESTPSGDIYAVSIPGRSKVRLLTILTRQQFDQLSQ